MSNAVDLITAINTLLQMVNNLGLSWQAVSDAVAKAKAEGREFGLQDLEGFRASAESSLAALNAAIAAAKEKP